MAESNGKKRALVVIDSDDDEAPLAPWVRTVSDQAEVAEIIEIKDEEEDDDDLFEKEMNVQYARRRHASRRKSRSPTFGPVVLGGGAAPQGRRAGRSWCRRAGAGPAGRRSSEGCRRPPRRRPIY